jgi:universal stress protein A
MARVVNASVPMTPPRTILVPVDLDDLAAVVLDYAAQLATRLDAEVQVIHVVPRPVFDAEVPDALVQAAIGDIAESAVGKLEPIVSPHRAGRYLAAVHVELGESVTVILSAAARLDVDLIIIGSHGRHGMSRLVLGSIAEQVARRAHCPVLLVRQLPYRASTAS